MYLLNKFAQSDLSFKSLVMANWSLLCIKMKNKPYYCNVIHVLVSVFFLMKSRITY